MSKATRYIDADALIEILNKKYKGNLAEVTVDFVIDRIIKSINKMPAAEVEMVRKWIPCSERLPEVYDSYLIAWRPAHMEEMQTWKVPHFYDIVEYSPAEGWLTEEIETDYENPEILAWMPLPEPYREDEGVINV